jgi:YVTN family beta-propeller protein
MRKKAEYLLSASYPLGVAVSPDGTNAYFANDDSSGTVSVVDTATNNIVNSFSVGGNPQAFGMFVGR